MTPSPVRVGRFWRFADGFTLPVISGGSDDSGTMFGADESADAGDDGGDGGDEAEKPQSNPETEIAKWKALARKHEQQAKANAAAAVKLKELEHAGKSETEKLQLMLEEERARARESTIKALKLQVATEKGLPPGLAKFLPDLEDEVDMMQAADELLEAAGAAATGAQPTRQPKSNLTNPLKDDDLAAQRERVIAAMTGRSALS